MASDCNTHTPLRQSTFTLDKLPQELVNKVGVPSVGIDFGSHHVRVAIIDNAQDKLAINLASYKIDDVEAALHFAKQHVTKDVDVSVFYTGHVISQTEALIQGVFANAKQVTRRDKLDSHNRGAHFLVTNFSEEQIFHDTSAIEQKLTQGSGMDMAAFATLMPPKMIGMMQKFMGEIMESMQKKFPVLLSLVGANHIICQLDDDANYKTVEGQCHGGYFMQTLWKAIGHPGHTDDFEHFIELASKGDRRKIDSLTSEILDFVGFYAIMPRDFPVFTLGKMERLKRDDVTPEDLARATLAMTTDFLISKATDYSKLFRTYKMYFAGSLVQHEFVRNEIAERGMGWGNNGMIKPKFFITDATAALGACVN